MKDLSQKIQRGALRASVAASTVGASAFALVNRAFAENGSFTGVDDYFGGQGEAESFASNSGLSSAELVPTISALIRMALGFLGIIAVIIILLGGFKWMTSGGDETKVKKAKALIFQGIIGLVIVLTSYAIATFVITSITSAIAA